MNAHGEYEIKKDGFIVHVYPAGAFNYEGIIELKSEVLNIVSTEKKWVLFGHHTNQAFVIPEALDALIDAFNEYALHGCIAIFQEASTVRADTLEKLVKPSVNIPFEINDDKNLLLVRAREAFERSD
ncbi:hypothetical protein OAP14_05890 [Aliiglaciecola sp.]|nr:hypothetical protein [Aliiglaciecola sp.]